MMVVNGKTLPWERLISTIHLNLLVRIVSDIDPEILLLSRKLKSSKGMIINLGLKQTPLHYNKTWIYFPDRNIHFYRVGFYSNVQPLLAPPGYSSMYVECSPLFFNNKKEALELIPVVINELIQLGFIEKNEDIVTKRAIYLDNNYCLPYI